MRSYPANYIAVETAREPAVAWLFHVFACRDGIVTLPNSWGSWCYSIGFQDQVPFTDARDYAGDGVQSRVYSPAAIEPAWDELAVIQDGTLDPRTLTITLPVDLEPFASYLHENWPLRFGLVVYKVHRTQTGAEGVRTVDNGYGVQVPVASIRWAGYLKQGTFKTGDTQKLETVWDHVNLLFDRQAPAPVFSLFCTKKLFSTGPIQLACHADRDYVRIDGTLAAKNQDVIRATAWATQPAGWFAGGLIEYEAVDPVSGKTFTFRHDVVSSKPVSYGGINYGELYVQPIPGLLQIGTTIRAYGGCDRSRQSCIAKHRPLGVNLRAGDLTYAEIDFQFNAPVPGVLFIAGSSGYLLLTGDGSNLPDVIVINATPVDLTWSINPGGLWVSDSFHLPATLPAAGSFTVGLINQAGNPIAITQQPAAGNSYSGQLDFPIAGLYIFAVFWGDTAAGDGNLRHFNGAPDMPVENPALESARLV